MIRLIKITICVCLLNYFLQMPAGAFEAGLSLPKPGSLVSLSKPTSPPVLKGLKINPTNPFKIDFILDPGEAPNTSDQSLKKEANRLIKYFLAAMTIPEDELWVNLSPYEKDRTIADSFGKTEMGRDLLAQDYVLKQLTASLIYPEGDIGKKFWKKIYEKAGGQNVPINTFNKVWIVPKKAVIFENMKNGVAYVVEGSLKVMLEEDYLAMSHQVIKSKQQSNSLGSQIVRDVVIPELENEVNQGKHFAYLRQAYHSLILAAWYKKKVKESLLSEIYRDQKKVAGISIANPKANEEIYEQYLKAFKKGVFNYIKDEVDPSTQKSVVKKYFSGGTTFNNLDDKIVTSSDRSVISKAVNKVVLMLVSATMMVASSTFDVQAASQSAQAQQSRSVPAMAQNEEVKSLTETDKKFINNYITAFQNGKANFVPYATGQNVARQLGYPPAMVNFYDMLRFMVLKQLDEDGQVRAEDILKLAEQIYELGKDESPYNKFGLEGFFKGIWGRYIVARANKQSNIGPIIDDLKYQASKHSPKLLNAVNAMISLPGNASDLQAESLIKIWQKLNIEYFIPLNLYVEMNVTYSRNGAFFQAVVNKINKSEVRNVNNVPVKFIYGEKIDLVNTEGSTHSVTGRPIIFIDSKGMDEEVRQIVETKQGKAFQLLRGRYTSPQVDNLVRELFAGMDANIIRIEVERIARRHEAMHQIKDSLGSSHGYKGSDRFGLTQEIWDRVNPGSRKILEDETASMLAEIITPTNTKVALFGTFMNLMTGDNNPYYFGSRWIFNKLAQLPADQWVDARNPSNVIRVLEELMKLEPKEIERRAIDLMDRSWSKQLREALQKADLAMMIVVPINEKTSASIADVDEIVATSNDKIFFGKLNGRGVVIKVAGRPIDGGGGSSGRLLLREIAVLKKIHEDEQFAFLRSRIPTVYGSGELDQSDLDKFGSIKSASLLEKGSPFIIMERIQDPTLDRYLVGKSLEETRDTLLKIAKELQELNNAGIVHGDLSSAEIFISPEGRIKLVDLETFQLPAELPYNEDIRNYQKNDVRILYALQFFPLNLRDIQHFLVIAQYAIENFDEALEIARELQRIRMDFNSATNWGMIIKILEQKAEGEARNEIDQIITRLAQMSLQFLAERTNEDAHVVATGPHGIVRINRADIEMFIRMNSDNSYNRNIVYIGDERGGMIISLNESNKSPEEWKRELELYERLIGSEEGAFVAAELASIAGEKLYNRQTGNNSKNSREGGINFNPSLLNLETNGEQIKFTIDPALLKEYQNAPGFQPQITSIQSISNISQILGI